MKRRERGGNIMQSGNNQWTEVIISYTDNISDFSDFECGIEKMDRFIHNGLEFSVKNNYCKLYKVSSESIVIALFALTFDSLYLDSADKEELQDTSGISLSADYSDTFWSKHHYPALEISYLAVSKDYRNTGLGAFLIEEIARVAAQQSLGGCQFLTVEALCHSEEQNYNAVGFYYKQDFIACEYPNPNKDTLRMFRPLYCLN